MIIINNNFLFINFTDYTYDCEKPLTLQYLRLAVGTRGTRTHTESTPGGAANGRPYAGGGYCLKITSRTMADLPTLISKIEYQENSINCFSHMEYARGVNGGLRAPLTKKNSFCL